MEDAQEDRSPGVVAGGYVFYDGECEMCRAAAAVIAVLSVAYALAALRR